MKNQQAIFVCIVLLAITVFASKQKPDLDAWAKEYNPLRDIKKNIEYLNTGAKELSKNSVKFPSFDIILKINQTDEPKEIDTSIVTKILESVTKAIDTRKCKWTYNSTEGTLIGNPRYSLFGGIECPSFDNYYALVNEPAFHQNVIFSRLAGRVVNSGFDSKKPPRILDPVIEPWPGGPIILDPWVPIRGPCDDYVNTPHKNWWADAMDNGRLDCTLVKDDCSYNQGFGGKFFLLDTGVDGDHPEFEGMLGSKLTYRNHLTTLELAGQDPYYDDLNHGTGLAALTIGKSLGAAKDASLTSIKIVSWNAEEEGYEVSITATTAALNQILAEVNSDFNAGRTRTPTVIYSGSQFVWSKNDKCYTDFIFHPIDTLILESPVKVIRKRDDVNTRDVAVPVDPNPPTPDPPVSGGRWQYDCAYPLMNAVRNLMARGIPYLAPAGNGFPSEEFGVATGVDMCFYAQWVGTVTDCVEYIYLPMFMTDGYYSSPAGSRPSYTWGYTNRALIIGGYQEDFKNAKWSQWDDAVGYGDYGGANYGSQWYKQQGKRCVDYAAPAARFQTVAIDKNQVYGNWEDYGYPGIVHGTDYNPAEFPISGTSYAVPLAAASIMATMVEFWNVDLEPSVFPDYGYGDRLIQKVDLHNVINNEIKVTDDYDIVNLYDYYGFYLTNSNMDIEGTCAYYYGTYYTSDNYPNPQSLVNIPHNRNLKIPAFESKKKSCRTFPPINTGLNTGLNTGINTGLNTKVIVQPPTPPPAPVTTGRFFSSSRVPVPINTGISLEPATPGVINTGKLAPPVAVASGKTKSS